MLNNGAEMNRRNLILLFVMRNEITLLLLAGIITAIWTFFSIGTLCIAILTITLLYVFNYHLKGLSERRIIIAICIIAIALRFTIGLSGYYFSWGAGIGADFIGDGRAYSTSGQYIAEVITSKPMPTIDGNEPAWLDYLRSTYKGNLPLSDYRMDAFAKYIGLIYSTFGYAPITVKFINSFLSIFTAILLFILVRDMFSLKAANITLVLSLFWPSIFLWSATGVKELLTIFLITICIFTFLKLRRHIGIVEFLLALAILIITDYKINVLFFICIFAVRIFKKFILKRQISVKILAPLALIFVMQIALYSLGMIRLHIQIPLLITFFLSISSYLYLTKKRLIFLLITIFCSTIFLVDYIVNKNNIDISKHYSSFTQEAIDIQKSQLYGANTGYRIYPDRYYETSSTGYPDITPPEFIVSYLKGLAYALASPFPWSNRFFVYFQIAYYILIPFILLGILVVLRYRWRDMLPLIIFIFIVASMYAFYEGNIGTVFRHRDMLMIFFLVFGAIGISNFFQNTSYVGKTK